MDVDRPSNIVHGSFAIRADELFHGADDDVLRRCEARVEEWSKSRDTNGWLIIRFRLLEARRRLSFCSCERDVRRKCQKREREKEREHGSILCF